MNRNKEFGTIRRMNRFTFGQFIRTYDRTTLESDMAQEAEGSEGNAASVRTPPYVAYKTFLTFLEDLKANGIPSVIDRSVLKRFSGGVGSQLLMAAKSLGLVTDKNEPTSRLVSLVNHYGTPLFNIGMKDCIRSSYPFLNNIDLMTATPSMFAEAFRNATGAKEDVLKKARRFYLQAAQETGIPLGPRILAKGNSGPRAANPAAANSTPKRKMQFAKAAKPPADTRTPPVDDSSQSIQNQLIAKYPSFDPAWPEQVQKAWFDGFQKLMATAVPTKENGGG